MKAAERQRWLDEIDHIRASRWDQTGALAAFVRLMWREVEPSRLQWAPYMDTVCDALHRQMLGEFAYQNLIIQLPPGFAKSLLVSVMAPAFEWLINPTRRKLFFSAGDSVNIRDSRRCRTLMQSRAYKRLLLEVCQAGGREPWTFARDQNQKANFETSQGGFRQVLTIKSGVTGLRGDDIVVDDPIDAKEVINGTMEAISRRLKEVNTTYDQVISSRLNNDPDRPSRRTIVMQRLATNDLAGHAARSAFEDWRVVCLPMRYEKDHPDVYELDPRTVDGEILHPGRYTEAKADRMAAQLGSQAAAQLQMRPVPKEGGMVKRAWINRWTGGTPEEAALGCAELIAAVDPASKAGDDNDFYSFQLWGRITTEPERMRLIHREAKRMTYPEFVVWMARIGAQWAPIMRLRPSCWLVEETANGLPWIQDQGRTFMGIPLVGFLPSRDFDGPDKSKAARFLRFQRAAEAGMVEVPDDQIAPWADTVIDQWCAFPRVEHDDDCDPASMVAQRWGTGTPSPARYTVAEVLGRAVRSGGVSVDDFAM